MRLNVSHKLFIMLLVVTGLVVFGMAIFMSWSFERGFINYVEARKQERIADFVTRLEYYYTEHGDWQDLKRDKAEWLDSSSAMNLIKTRIRRAGSNT